MDAEPCGTDRYELNSIFHTIHGAHMLMGNDLGVAKAANEVRESKMVSIGKNLPREVLKKGLHRSVRNT